MKMFAAGNGEPGRLSGEEMAEAPPPEPADGSAGREQVRAHRRSCRSSAVSTASRWEWKSPKGG
jgi:hypothetical protein